MDYENETMDPLKDDDIQRTEDGLVFNPYNSENIEITLNDVQCILTKYGLPPLVYNMDLYKRAFVHRSYVRRPQYENDLMNIKVMECPKNCLPLRTKSNERLEYLGDGVLELVTKYYLYRRFPKANEGFLTEKKIAIVKNEAIGRIVMDMGLNKWLILSRHSEEKKTRTHIKKLGCLFESFLGALFLDFNKIPIQDSESWFETVFVTGPGFQMAQKFVESIFERHIDWVSLIQNDDNYKNLLQVRIQKEFKVTPFYLEMEMKTELDQYKNQESQQYKMGVFLCIGQPIHSVHWEQSLKTNTFKTLEEIHNHISSNKGKIFLFLGEGIHKIKRKAEQEACFQALQEFNRIGII
jgi:dsRNA-specific ribonuclease